MFLSSVRVDFHVVMRSVTRAAAEGPAAMSTMLVRAGVETGAGFGSITATGGVGGLLYLPRFFWIQV